MGMKSMMNMGRCAKSANGGAVEKCDKATLPAESVAKVDRLLRGWVKAGECVPDTIRWRADVGTNTADVRDAIVSMLRMLAHCAQMTVLQEVVARGGVLSVSGPCEEAAGFLRAADLIERVLSDERIPDDCRFVRMPSADETAMQWDEVRKAKSHVVGEIEELCPGWTEGVMAALEENHAKTTGYLVATGRITAAPGGSKDPNRHMPDSGFAARIARNMNRVHAE